MLNNAYKILFTILQVLDNLPNIKGDHHYGFTRGRSTVDALHMVKQIIEKGREYNINSEILLVDFEQASDKIKTKKYIRSKY